MSHLPRRSSGEGISGPILGCNQRWRHSPMPPRLLCLQLILQSLGDCFGCLAFQSLFLPSNGLQSEFLSEIIDFPRQPPVLGFPRSVVCLDFCLELVKRLVRRCRILEEGPIITEKEMIEELVRDVKVLMLNVSSSTSKYLATVEEGNGYTLRRRSSPGRMSCSLRSEYGRQKC
jgi:hypothetical protein